MDLHYHCRCQNYTVGKKRIVAVRNNSLKIFIIQFIFDNLFKQSHVYIIKNNSQLRCQQFDCKQNLTKYSLQNIYTYVHVHTWNLVGKFFQLCHKKTIQVVSVWVESSCQLHVGVKSVFLKTNVKVKKLGIQLIYRQFSIQI